MTLAKNCVRAVGTDKKKLQAARKANSMRAAREDWKFRAAECNIKA